MEFEKKNVTNCHVLGSQKLLGRLAETISKHLLEIYVGVYSGHFEA